MEPICATEWLQTLPAMKGKAGLERMQALMEQLGNPQDSYDVVHLAGTNGKGTCASLLSNVLVKAGYRTGLTISPYVLDFRERFQINGVMISPQELEALADRVRTAAQKAGVEPVQFEAVTAVAFLWFAQQGCDICVLETGLGGRWDATNVVKRTRVAGITRIDLDHTGLLGNTRQQIAAEKAGILKPGCIPVSYPQQSPEVMQVLQQAAEKLGTELRVPDLAKLHWHTDAQKAVTRMEYGEVSCVLPFLGQHQVYNAAMVIQMVQGLRECGYAIPDTALVQGVETTRFAARIEVLNKHPWLILDGCHNPAGAKALADTLKQWVDAPIVGLVGVMQDKQVQPMLEAMLPLCSKLYLVQPDTPRSMPVSELAQLVQAVAPTLPIQVEENLKQAAQKLLAEQADRVVFGSLYLASQIRPLLQENPQQE